jgi:hypothetical protein
VHATLTDMPQERLWPGGRVLQARDSELGALIVVAGLVLAMTLEAETLGHH